MTFIFLAGIGTIAFLDSLNPSLFIAQFYLLTTPQPTKRTLSYIAGIVIANFIGGLLVLGGVRAIFAEVVTLITPLMPWLHAILGALLLFFAFRQTQAAATPMEAKKPTSLRPLHTFILGVVVMGNELTTALPYFVAIERIVEANLPPIQVLLTLGLYNLIFALPLFAFLWLFLRFQARFVASLTKLQQTIQHWIGRILRWAALIFGVILFINGVLWLLTGNPVI